MIGIQSIGTDRSYGIATKLGHQIAMITTRIQIFGLARYEEMKAALSEFLGQTEIRLCQGLSSTSDLESLRECDLVICFVESNGTTKLNELFRFARIASDKYPYIPIVVVGVPTFKLRSFQTLSGLRLLPKESTALRVALEASRLLHRSWWFGVRNIDLPAVLVDGDGWIVRANDQAFSRFGESLVNCAYRIVVEKATSAEIPADHPISQTIRECRSLIRYHEYPQIGLDAERTQLMCSPILGLRNNVAAVAVVFMETNASTRILKAASAFAKQDTLEGLVQTIVDQVGELGYRRARLYEYLPSEKRLRGCASIGFDPQKESWFKQSFSVSADEDRPTKETLESRLPRLCIHGMQDDRSPRAAFEGNLVRFYAEPHYENELETGTFDHWIEAPIVVPTRPEKSETSHHLWGKLCVDHTKDSWKVDAARDVSDIALFANVAASAIAAIQRREQDRHHLALFRKYSQRLASANWRTPHQRILPSVIETLLEMYVDITGADVAFYREFQGDTIQLCGEPKWRTGAQIEHVQVPKVKRRGEGTHTRILDMDEPSWFFNNDARSEFQAALRSSADGRWTQKEAAFLNWIGSEVCIPVVVHDNLRGVIAATSSKVNAFSDDLVVAVERFMHTARLWFELGELHDERLWASSVLGEFIALLPKLAEAQSDDSFFAVLSAFLSAHDGLRWNRVLIFSCNGLAPETAELVYALGGCGEGWHSRVQHEAAKLRLNDLVKARLLDPVPRGCDESGMEVIDSLYELCVAIPRKAQEPIRIPFGSEGSNDHSELERSNPLRWMLEQDYANGANFEVPLLLDRSVWCQRLNHGFPDIIFAPVSYAFPLVGTYANDRKPLGLVLVDTHYTGERNLDQITAISRVILELATDVLALRHKERFLRGWLGVLPAFRHGLGLNGTWDVFRARLGRLLQDATRERSNSFDGSESDLASQIRTIEESADVVHREIEQVRRVKAAMEPSNDRIIGDLGEFIDLLANAWEGRYSHLRVQLRCDEARGLSLPCDPAILQGTLACLVENAVTISQGHQNQNLVVQIKVEREYCQRGSFSEIVAIKVTDNGPGIAADVAPFIFLDGFTSRVGAKYEREGMEAKHLGRGLSVARAQLLAYHGDLQLEHPGPRRDPMGSTKTIGSTFVLRFGIPSDAGTRVGGRNDEVHVARRR